VVKAGVTGTGTADNKAAAKEQAARLALIVSSIRLTLLTPLTVVLRPWVCEQVGDNQQTMFSLMYEVI
jgi:uncharacterized membrane protein YadS